MEKKTKRRRGPQFAYIYRCTHSLPLLGVPCVRCACQSASNLGRFRKHGCDARVLTAQGMGLFGGNNRMQDAQRKQAFAAVELELSAFTELVQRCVSTETFDLISQSCLHSTFGKLQCSFSRLCRIWDLSFFRQVTRELSQEMHQSQLPRWRDVGTKSIPIPCLHNARCVMRHNWGSLLSARGGRF